MNKYEILLLDLDDTLIDNLENIKHAFKVMLEHMGDTYSNEKFDRWYNLDKQFWIDRQNGKIIVPDEYEKSLESRARWVRTQRQLLYFNNEISLEQAFEINDLYLNALNEVVLPIDGAKEVLEYLSSKYKIVITTNGPSVATESKVRKIGCFDYIDHILAADMIGHNKPSVDFFIGVKEFLGTLDESKYLVIGDSLYSDIGGAMNANMDSCWFNRGVDKLTDEHKPTMIIDSLKTLMELL